MAKTGFFRDNIPILLALALHFLNNKVASHSHQVNLKTQLLITNFAVVLSNLVALHLSIRERDCGLRVPIVG